ncbi:DUF86 domain-containing protein [uncultured Fusobacterium sp.]|uniref:type VII toxin-antitoxin system HepT family RNase toxin n=1 Tax=uncultured Fusobacterium sp. TaxID=159267 RepID=UPI0025EADEE4|nr:DUF86 domain-containing protein [uncultured Fusobacterium sp.]
MKDDIIINKIEVIKRCIKRVEEEYDNNILNLENYTKQDSIILNLQRMCEATLDLAFHYIKMSNFEIPQTNKEAFKVLENRKIIDKDLSNNLQGMVGFRNIAVHDYQVLNLEILKNILEKHLYDSIKFSKCILEK